MFKAASSVSATPKVIVSLTTYGTNASKLAPRAILSLLRQTTKPDKVILWLGYGSKINFKLRFLMLRGLEVKFCEDIGPSTKAIPALENFPNDIIVTADDDIIYPKNWLVRLLKAHQRYPKRIITHRAHGIKVDENCKIRPYSEWEKCIDPRTEEDSMDRWDVFPTGVGGVLYPVGSIPTRAFNVSELLSITPKNDDIWLWAMANINSDYFNNQPPYVVLHDGYSKDLVFVDPKREMNSTGTLGGSNVLAGGNDLQIKRVVRAIPELKKLLTKMV